MRNRQPNITYHGLFLACVLTPVSGAFSLVAAAAAAGYQEIMTDPSYKGQFVVFTHPHIGNVGINDGESQHRNVVIMSTPYAWHVLLCTTHAKSSTKHRVTMLQQQEYAGEVRGPHLSPSARKQAAWFFLGYQGGWTPTGWPHTASCFNHPNSPVVYSHRMRCATPPFLPLIHPTDDEESMKCHLGAIIVRDLSIVVSNYRSVMTLDEYCKKHNVLGISGIDTRQLTKVGGRGGGVSERLEAVHLQLPGMVGWVAGVTVTGRFNNLDALGQEGEREPPKK